MGVQIEDAISLSSQEEDAFALTRAALAISQAQSSGDESQIARALDDNLQLWVGISTLVKSEANPLPREIKENLIRLSQFVVQKTFEMQDEVRPTTLETFTNMNLQIAEGLLEGHQRTIN